MSSGANPTDLALSIRGQSGDALYKIFCGIDDMIDDQFPGYLKLPLAERSHLIGKLYAEVEKLP